MILRAFGKTSTATSGPAACHTSPSTSYLGAWLKVALKVLPVFSVTKEEPTCFPFSFDFSKIFDLVIFNCFFNIKF